MNRIPLIGILVLIIVIIALPLSQGTVNENSYPPIKEGNILYVGGFGPGNYTSIQEAVNDASDYDTVFVFDDSSPYEECVDIKVRISLIGEDKENKELWQNVRGTIDSNAYMIFPKVSVGFERKLIHK